MHTILNDGTTHILRFDHGEEMLGGVIKFCKEHEIFAGYFSAIGATKEVLLAYYNLAEKKYEDHLYQKDMEIVSVLGNISTNDQGIIPHAHGSFSDQQLNVWAGHVKRLIVSATGEVVLTALNGTMRRELDSVTGLRLLVPHE